MESDLEAVIQDQTIVLSPADIKSYMRMILQALATCHQHWVVHRDVKPNNMLLAATGGLPAAISDAWWCVVDGHHDARQVPTCGLLALRGSTACARMSAAAACSRACIHQSRGWHGLQQHVS